MTSATKTSFAVSSRYAGALIDLAEDAKILDKVEKDVLALRSMIADSAELAKLINSPLINAEKRDAALRAIADKARFQELTFNFLGVLGSNRRLNALPAIIDAFEGELSARRGEVTINVQTAQALTSAQTKALQDSFSKGLGGAQVSVKAKVEPGILGGMIVTVGSQMIDDSVARKLERLKASMNKQSNQNFTSKIEEVG